MTSRRIAFVDHSYHQKTRSTFFLREALFPAQPVEDWWDESWNGGASIDVERLVKQCYDVIVVVQTEVVAEALARHGYRSVIFIPMWDSCRNLPETWWQALDGFRIISFCGALHERLRRCGLSTIHLQYYPDPSAFPLISDFADLRGFFWQRHQDLRWHYVVRLVGETPFSRLHFHIAQDPGAQLAEPPSRAEQERHNITLSWWFERRQDYHEFVARSNVYFAPRPSEGIGFSFLEAMAMGMCVVAPDMPTMNEYVTDSVTGLLWDLASPKPLDFSQAAELGRRARDKVAVGHQKWLSDLPTLREFLEAPSHRLAMFCDSVRFRGGSIRSIQQRAQARSAYAYCAPTATSQDPSTGGLRKRGITKRDLIDTPLVTVVTVTLNCIDQFEGTIRNVLRQDHPNLEVIVIDGGSTDGTLDLIRRYDDYVDLWTSGEDGGPYDAMNKAANLANGRYVLFMNAGDWFIGEDAVSRAMRNTPPNADFIIGHHIYRQLDGAEALHKASSFETTWRRLTDGELSDSWLGGVPCHQATLTRTQVLREQHYNAQLRIAADHKFMYRQRSKGARFHHCDTLISLYASGGLSAKSHLRCLDEWIEIVSNYASSEAAERYFGPARRAVVAGQSEGSPAGENLFPKLNAARAELDVVRAELNAARAELDVVHAELDVVCARAKVAEGRLKALEASTSWRVTAPLRRIRLLLG